MAVATAPVSTRRTPHEQSMRTTRPIKATAATYYVGAMVCIDATGFVVKASDTAALIFAGICAGGKGGALKEIVIAAGGADGEQEMDVDRPRYFCARHSGLVRADEGKLVFAVDDQLVALAATTTNDITVGRINRWISATEVEIETLPFGQIA